MVQEKMRTEQDVCTIAYRIQTPFRFPFFVPSQLNQTDNQPLSTQEGKTERTKKKKERKGELKEEMSYRS